MNILPSLRGARARALLEAHFPSKQFEPSLVQRVVKKGRQKIFGNDSDAMNIFMEYARNVSSNGGVFEYSFDDTLRLNEILLQTQSMASYSKAFNDFTIVDATFSVSA